MKNLLAKVIIKATKENQTDIALERMTHLAVQKNLASQQALVRSQQGNLSHLQEDVYDLQRDIKSKDLEISQLQQKLRIALQMYEQANSNCGSWIELLNQPLHVIASKHAGFKKSFEAMTGTSANAGLAKEQAVDWEALLHQPFEEIALEHRGFRNNWEAMQWTLVQLALDNFCRGEALWSWIDDMGDDDLEAHILVYEKMQAALTDRQVISMMLGRFYCESMQAEELLVLVDKFHAELEGRHASVKKCIQQDIAASGDAYDFE